MEKDKKLDEIAVLLGKYSRTLKIIRLKSDFKVNSKSDFDSKEYADKARVDDFFHKNFQTRVAVTHGDVFMVNMNFECGNELSGNHFVVALNDSKEQDPMVTVVPLKSYKGVINPRSDLLLGKIEGISTGNESIALINQVKGIDKYRMFEHTTVAKMKAILNDATIAEDDEIEIRVKRVYRLSKEQYEKLLKAVFEFLRFGYIQH